MAIIYDMNEGMAIIGKSRDEAVDEQSPDREIVPLPMPALQEATHTETALPAATAYIIATEILGKE